MWRLNYLSDTHETLHNKMHDEDLSPVNFKFFLTIILFELYRFVMLQLRKIILYCPFWAITSAAVTVGKNFLLKSMMDMNSFVEKN